MNLPTIKKVNERLEELGLGPVVFSFDVLSPDHVWQEEAEAYEIGNSSVRICAVASERVNQEKPWTKRDINRLQRLAANRLLALAEKIAGKG